MHLSHELGHCLEIGILLPFTPKIIDIARFSRKQSFFECSCLCQIANKLLYSNRGVRQQERLLKAIRY